MLNQEKHLFVQSTIRVAGVVLNHKRISVTCSGCGAKQTFNLIFFISSMCSA